MLSFAGPSDVARGSIGSTVHALEVRYDGERQQKRQDDDAAHGTNQPVVPGNNTKMVKNHRSAFGSVILT